MNMNDYRMVADRMQPSEHCRDEVLGMKTTKITHKKNRKFTPLLIAAAVAVCGGGMIIAADSMGAFEKLVGVPQKTDAQGFSCNKYDRNNYKAIAENAVIPEEITTAANEKLSVTCDSVYCDGTSLILGLTGEFYENVMKHYEFVGFDCEITVNGRVYNLRRAWEQDCGFWRFDGSLYRDDSRENGFTGSISVGFTEEHAITEPTTVEVRMYNIGALNYNESLESRLGDDVTFTVEVTPDVALIQEPLLSMEQDGFGAKIYEISPAGIITGSIYPEWYDTNTEKIELPDGTLIPKYGVCALWYDENGNGIPGLDYTKELNYGDGYFASPHAYSETSKITVKWVNKQQQDENGNPEVLYEYTFDLTE